MLKKSNFIGITMGDPGGIGPEISIKSSEYFMKVGSHIMPIIFGSLEHLSYISKNIVKTSTPINLIKPESSFEYSYRSGFLNVVDLSSISYKSVKLGGVNPKYAREVEHFIAAAVDFSLKGKIAGFATAPINKGMMIRGGARFGGHTELLGYLTSSEHFAMLFYSKKIITVLATIHIPLKAVSAEITVESLRKIISISVNSMKMDFGKNNPSIAVLGLNPHAGENGDIGIEESDTIESVVKEFREEGINISGPFPADSFFAKKYKMFDLIVSMYHDQALIPFKLLSFDKGVNVTLGLKIIRTSPVHGTAYDIAGKSSANCNSMIESIKLVDDISRNRHKWTEKL